MTGIEKHLAVLLLDNDCVTVPGLGGFVAHRLCSRYDEDETAFLPPLRTVGFNQKLTINDSLLAQSYIAVLDISYPEAMQLIERDVNDIRQGIENNGSYELNGIGTLELNDEGNYEFEPCEAGLLTPALYGLCPFGMQPLESGSTEASEPAKATGAGVAQELSARTRHVGADSSRALSATAADEPRRVSLTTGIMAAAAAAIIIVLLFLSPNPIEQTNRKELMSMLGVLAPRPASDNKPESAEPASVAAESPAAVPVPTPDTVQDVGADSSRVQDVSPQTKPTPYYTIVLACKIPLRNAEAYAGQLTAAGYENIAVMGSERNNKVVCGEYATQNEAYNALNKLRRSNQAFAEAWVYKVKSAQ